MTDTTAQERGAEPVVETAKRRRAGAGRRRVAWGVSWGILVPVLLLALAYAILLFRPLPVPFVGQQARAMVLASMPDNMDLELGSTFLSLKGGGAPVLRFAPVVLTDRATGGKVEMEALEVGFSPFRAILGQPGAEITLVAPRLQVIQDLLGPRLARFELYDDPGGGHGTVRIIEGDSAFPTVDIKSEGLGVRENILGVPALTLRSDNDWLVYNLQAGEEGIRSIIENSEKGIFSKFSIRDGELEMHDSVYGLVRTFEDIDLEISTQANRREVKGTLSAVIAGKRFQGTILRTAREGSLTRLIMKFKNLDFSAFVPFMDDPDGAVALHGTGAIVAEVAFAEGEAIDVLGALFLIDLNGTQLRIQDDNFPVRASPVEISWNAKEATFNMSRMRFQAGNSYADISGVFVMGLDENFGPTMRMSTSLTNIYLHPGDLGPPEEPIEQLQFIGWSAPLYGALGIESLAATSGELKLVTSGRMDMLQSGLAVNMNVAIEGATADDLKRMWPYFLGGDTRDWFVQNVLEGRVLTSAMEFSFPVGTIGGPGEDLPVPDDAIKVEMLAEGVTFALGDTLEPVSVAGLTHLKVANGATSIGFGRAELETGAGAIGFSNTTFSISGAEDGEGSVFVIEGVVSAPVSALVALQETTSPDLLEGMDLPVELDSLAGQVETSLTARITLEGPDNGVRDMDYALEGRIADLDIGEPVSSYRISDGQFAFTLTPREYRLEGPVRLNGLRTDMTLRGELREDATPEIKVSSTFDADDFKQFGFDVSQFIGGRVRFTGQPLADGSLKVDVDLKDASMSVADIGLYKSRGSAGTLSALVRFEDPLVNISDIDLRFGTVRLAGEMVYHQENGLVSADFPRFAIREGDDAQVRLVPTQGGYAVRLRGRQLDLKPLMRRFFSLESGGTGGPQATGIDETIELDVSIERALGFYSTTAFNLNVDMRIRGDDLQKVALQAQFGGTNSLSITTNPVPGGRVMSVAFGDLGTLLRFLGTYPRLTGGEGSLVMTSNEAEKVDVGEFTLYNFSLIDEANVAQVLGNNPRSRELIARQNRIDFNSGRARFIRRPDRIEIIEAVLDGGTQGGTARGFIYTDAGQYDLVGTYIPLFELNNAFQQIPLLGPLLGGREGEGLLGVTFAIRGPLANPTFSVNPLSILVPGAFRSLFEFRSEERPR